MAGSLNKVQLIGNLGKDAEIRTMANGEKVANLAIATSESWTDKQSGERKEKTEWSRVVIWNDRLVDVAEKYCTKGRKLYVEGALETRKYTDNSGVERYQTEVVLRKFRGELTLLDSQRSEAVEFDNPRTTNQPSTAQPRPDNRTKRPAVDLDDSIPF